MTNLESVPNWTLYQKYYSMYQIGLHCTELDFHQILCTVPKFTCIESYHVTNWTYPTTQCLFKQILFGYQKHNTGIRNLVPKLTNNLFKILIIYKVAQNNH